MTPARALARLACAAVPCMAAAAAWPQTVDTLLKPQQTVLNLVWEVAPTPTDRMSTTDPAEARRFAMLGPMYYLAARQQPGTQPLVRVRAANGDHRSALKVSPGDQLESVLGYLWPAAQRPPGSGQVWAATNPTSGDQGLVPGAGAPPGYLARPLGDAYAWPRFGSSPVLLKLDGTQLGISSNLAAGGALWSLQWRGQQFIDQLDYGRLVQSSLSFAGPGASKALPTEGGDQFADANPSFMHGSPVLSSGNSVSAQGKTQSTRAMPLEWRHTDYNGGHAAQPVAYTGWQLGKDITLDDAAVQLGADQPQWAGQVARYVTVFVNGGPALPQADIEIPTAYLKPAFRRAFTCDATQKDATTGLREVFSAQFEQLDAGTWHHEFHADAGGVILANDSLTHALGIYGTVPEQGGSARYFTLWRFGSATAPTVNKMSAGAGPQTINPGTHRYQSWLVAGQAREVCAVMQRLYTKGLR